MKKCILSFVVVLVFFSLYSPKQAYAQYQSVFGSSQTSWNMNTWIWAPEFVFCVPDSIWIGYNQDTVFQGMLFKPLYRNSSSNNLYLSGYVSEDTTVGKVWFKGVGMDTSIHEIMNMSLTVNDSFYIDYGVLGGLYVDVDSVYFLNGRKHIRLDHEVEINSGPPHTNSHIKYTMIEGVGVNTKGIEMPQRNAILVNHWKDSVLVYSASLDSIYICQTATGISENSSKVHVKIYPNPVRHIITIEVEGIKAEKIELFDLQGRLVENLPIQRILSLEDIKNGIYVLKITTIDDQEISEKVVVQH